MIYKLIEAERRLIRHIEELTGRLGYWMTDIEPIADFVGDGDATTDKIVGCDVIITNPPWNRKLLHPITEHLSNQLPTWLLFDADWIHTKQSVPYLTRLKKVVSIGRVKWIEGSKSVGKDNCCWYLFDNNDYGTNGNPIRFFGRTE